ncbi:MAG: hypothetical protein IPK72_14645 [Candidatus Eisenbacteria bacterium]|nr:hypothetical protein [Candidatus Eisenbacteria bacterium]
MSELSGEGKRGSGGWGSRSGAAARGIVAGLAIGIVFVAIVVLAFATRDMQEAPPRLVGAIWSASLDTADSSPGRRLYYLMEERRVRRGYFDVEGVHSYYLPYSIFTLHSRTGQDGSDPLILPIARIDAGRVDAKAYRLKLELIDAPVILGPDQEILWVWNHGLEGRSLRSLTPVWSNQKLREMNPELSPRLPKEAEQYKFLGRLNALVFRGTDARYYRVDAGSGAFTVIADTTLAALSPEHSKTADLAWRFLQPAAISLANGTAVGVTWSSIVDPATRTWYGLLASGEKPPREWQHPRYTYGGPSGPVSRSLHWAGVALDQSGVIDPSKLRLDLSTLESLPEQRFLMGGFLRRPGTETVWWVNTDRPRSSKSADGGRALLVLHKSELGDDHPWQLTRVETNGSRAWTSNTGLSEIGQLADGGEAVVFVGTAGSTARGSTPPEILVFIDESSGSRQSLILRNGEPEQN